jgi:cystathionine beta-synthase
VNEVPDAYRPDQYHNQANPQAHYDSTGPEIWQQTRGRVTHFVAGAGTGGTITGVGRFLKEQSPTVQIIVADPANSVYSGGDGRPYLVEGVGEDFWPDTYDPEVVDSTIAISDADSFAMAHRVTKEEGILIGGSGGTAVAAALRVAEGLTADDLVVVLIPDSGRGYLSKVFDKNWMITMGFTDQGGATVADVISGKPDDKMKLTYVNPQATVREAIEIMQAHNLSHIPVAKGEMPLAVAEVIGSVSEDSLREKSLEAHDILERAIEELMDQPLPIIGVGEALDVVAHKMEKSPVALVLVAGKPHTLLTRVEVLQSISADPREVRAK